MDEHREQQVQTALGPDLPEEEVKEMIELSRDRLHVTVGRRLAAGLSEAERDEVVAVETAELLRRIAAARR